MSYIHNAQIGVHSTQQPDTKQITLFDKPYVVYDDEWRTHLHIICTYQCNAKCSFCVEKDSKCDASTKFLTSVRKVLAEMSAAGILNTVSITGGEPTIFKDLVKLVDMVKGYDVFLTMNTNGARLHKLALDLDGKIDCINVSRHYVDDVRNKAVFLASIPTLDGIRQLRKAYPNTAFRMQAVVNEDTNLTELSNLVHDGLFDDISIRQLMLDGSKESIQSRILYRALVNEALEKGELIEQEIQDYYVYEVHEFNEVSFTFSYSDMELLKTQEAQEDANFIREFIIKPDGVFTGSWFDKKSIN